MGSRDHDGQIEIFDVNSENWREVTKLEVTPDQHDFVADPSYYLALCAYGGIWKPLAICLQDQVIGFMMWGDDPDERSCWLGGFIIDHRYQRRGNGKQALSKALAKLSQEHGYSHFALSYKPTNTAAKALYASMGFLETDEWADDEVVARYYVAD